MFPTKTLILVAVTGIMVYLIWNKYRRWQNGKQSEALFLENQETACKGTSDESIFISVPSYRDPECVRTLVDCFQKATCPFRIFVGVCVQDEAYDPNPEVEYRSMVSRGMTRDFYDQIRFVRIPARDAKGPMYARSLIEQQLYRGEKYYLMIDSHTRFIAGWDEECIKEFKRCLQDCPKPVLTMYPNDFVASDRSGFTKMGASCESAIPLYLRAKEWCTETGALKIEGALFSSMPLRPLPSLFWGACFSFSSGKMIQECPMDPNLHYLFFGEEHLMALRYFTHGYDFFTPCRSIVRHKWSREGRRGTFWEQWTNNKDKVLQERISRDRLQMMLGLKTHGPPLNPLYGFGRERPATAYFAYSGAYPSTRALTPEAKLGILATARQDEIICKFGSETKLKKLREKV